MSTCKAVVLAVILALCTGISRGQCPATCHCDGTVVRCKGQQLLTIPLSLPDATTYLDLYNNSIASLPADALQRLTNLKTLGLGSNRIASLPANGFEGLRNLQTL
ncbi:biglycan-like [Dreissena polymorpha]|nr:biglycan-like [Dreissena polymorpha]